MARTKGSGFKMKGSPMQRNFGIGSPLHDEKEVGSTQEVEITSDRVYKDDPEGSVKSAGMIRLERNEPSKDDKGWPAWKAAYDKAAASHIKEAKRDIAAKG